jgi:KUP system potassium uptake protein
MNGATDKKPSLLWLAALGVVFGDIGTSPLYAFQSAISLTATSDAVPIVSLIIWTVFLVVSVKYAFLMMREDYKGEGGVFALFSLLQASGNSRISRGIMIAVVVFGASLMLGDGTLTPAISVLSAVQGVVTVHPGFAPYTVVTTCAIIILLFAAQRFGTGRLGSVFGPVMMLWFATIGVLGLVQIVRHPEVLMAFDPRQGLGLLARSGWHGLAIVGAVALAVTGAEALYADLSNFGRQPILKAWYYVTFPALLLNYLGQAAYVMHDPAAAKNPSLFFLLCPIDKHVPQLRGLLVLLATAATIIASQALISAVFTLVRQAKSLSLLPPFLSRHTNSLVREQIYIPTINFLLGSACVFLIVVFQTSNSLANAYGVAVTGAMAVTSLLWASVMFSRPDVSPWRTGIILAGLLVLDLSLFISCLTKFFQGGYMPFCLAVVIMGVMFSWYRGKMLIDREISRDIISPKQLGDDLEKSGILRVGGTRVFITRESKPHHSVASILKFHERTKDASDTIVILMLPSTWSNPHQVIGDPVVKKHAGGLWEITVPHGYMVESDAPASLKAAMEASGGEFSYDPEDVYFVLPREYLAACRCYALQWQKRLFNFFVRNVGAHVNIMKIPPKILIGYLAYIELDCKAGKSCDNYDS